eukprot:g4390.t1
MLVSCGGSNGNSSGGPQPFDEETSLLVSVADGDEFLDAFKQGVESQITTNTSVTDMADGAPLAFADSSADEVTTAGSFTTTYTLEADVDEYDLVKYNGEHLFITRSYQNYCCDIALVDEPADDLAAPLILPAASSNIRILATDTDEAMAEEVGSIDLDSGDSALGLYIEDDQLLALTTSYYYGTYGSVWTDIGYWAEQTLGVQIYDIENIVEPELDWDIEIEGSLVQSRRVGDRVYFVTRHTPLYGGFNYYPLTAEQTASNEQMLDELTLADIVPQISVNGEVSDLFDPSACFVTNEELDSDGAGYPVITSITAVSIDDPSAMETVCYNESANGVYVSDAAIYLTDVRYHNDDGATRVHKFSTEGSGISYRGSAEVVGYLWSWGQRDFRISEHEGMLRLVTSTFENDSDDSRDHHLYILEEDSVNLELDLVAQLPNGVRTDELGKPNEDLYGVRFFGDRAYMVTFERIDPLYVLDLSDADDPQIAGELEVPGFSDFLHPVNNDLLLGLGAEEAWGSRVKLELFDVSELSAPRSIDVEFIGEASERSYSEAQTNRYAFTYLANAENGTDRFGVPAYIWGTDEEDGYYAGNALHLFEITDKDTPAVAAMQQVESSLQDYLVQIDELPMYTVEVVEYERGYLSSKATISFGLEQDIVESIALDFELGDDADFARIAEGIDVYLDTAHGPLLTKHGLSVGWADMTAVFDRATYPQYAAFFDAIGQDRPLAWSMHVDLMGSGWTKSEIPDIDATIEEEGEQARFVLKGNDGITTFTDFGLFMETKGSIEEMSVTIGAEQNAVFALRDMRIDSEFTLDNSIWMGFGSMEAGIGSIELSTDQVNFDAEDTVLHAIISQGRLPDSISIRESIRIETADFNGYEIKNAVFAFAYQNLSKALLEGYMTDRTLQTERDPEKLNQHMKEYYEPLLKDALRYDPGFDLESVAFQSDNGSLDASASIAIDSAKLGADIDLQNPFALLPALTAFADVDISENLLKSILLLKNKSDLSNLPEEGRPTEEEIEQMVDTQMIMCLMIAAVLVLLWQPSLLVERLKPNQNAIALMLDTSESMAYEDDGELRIDLARDLLDSDPVSELSDNYQTDKYVFSDKALQVDDYDQLPDPGSVTRIGDSLLEVLERAKATSLAAVVLVSDGSESGDALSQEQLAEIASFGVPVHVLGVGREQIIEDIELERLVVPDRVLPNTLVTAEASIRHDAGGAARLKVYDGEEFLASRDVELDADAGSTAVRIEFDLGEAGFKELSFQLDPIENELNLENNRRTHMVEVADQTYSVLYVEGEPRWEYKYIRRALTDDPTTELMTLLWVSDNKFYRQGINDPSQLETGFPEEKETLFAFDAIVIGSIEAPRLSAEQQQLIYEFVSERGGSLLMLGGRNGLGDGGWGNTAVGELLPVRLKDLGESYVKERASVSLTPHGAGAAFLTFDENPDTNAERWVQLPALDNYQALGTLRPAASTLLGLKTTLGGREQPLLVTQRYGRGQSFVLATGGTWRWQMNLPSEDDSHETFWRQMMRALVVNSPEKMNFSVEAQGSELKLTAEVYDDNFQPLEDVRVLAVMNSDGPADMGLAAGVELSASPEVAGRYETRLPATDIGTYFIDAIASRGVGMVTATQVGAYLMNISFARAAIVGLISLCLGLGSNAALAKTLVGLVQGLPGEDYYQRQFDEQAQSILDAAKNLTQETEVAVFQNDTASSEALLAWLGETAASSTAEDRLVLFFIGHGSYDDTGYKFNLPGPDLSGEALKNAVDAIDAELKLIVNTSSSSGALLEVFEEDAETLLITATKTGRERNATRFGRFFVEALADESADLDKNELISAKEAYEFAERATADFYSSEGLIATEHSVLKGEHANLVTLASLSDREPLEQSPELAELYQQREDIDLQIERLRMRRVGMNAEDYQQAFRDLLLRLSLLQAEIDGQTANRLFGQLQGLTPEQESRVKTRWAELYAESHQLQEALNIYTEAAQLDGGNVHAELGALLVLTASNDPQAKQALASLLDEIGVPASVRLKSMLTLAYLALQENQLDRAEQLLDLSGGLANNHPATELEYLSLRASLAVRYREAPEEWIDQALAINSHYGDIYAVPAYFYMITFNYDKTGEFFQKAVDIQPDHWRAHLELGANHLRQNRPTAARKHFEISYEGDAFDPEAVNSLRLMDTYEELQVLNYPENPDGQLLPTLSLRLGAEERDLLAPYASRLAQQAIDTFSERYQFELKETATIEMYPNHDDFIVRSLGMPGAGLLGVAFGYLVAMDSPSAKAGSDYHWGTTLWHEVAHIFTLEASGHRVPRWFSEGVSVYEEWQTGPIPGTRIPLHVYQSLIEHDFLPVDELDSGFVRPQYENQVIVSYMQAGLICEYIAETYGTKSIVDMLNAYQRGLRTKEIIEEVFETSVSRFDNGFAQYFADNYADFLGELPAWMEHQQRASESYRAKDWEQVVVEADQAIALHPRYTESNSPYLIKARALREMGDEQAQMSTLEAFWKAGGYQLEPLHELSKHFVKEGRTQEAIQILTGLNLVSPFELDVHFQLGDLLMDTGEYQDALVEYEVAMALDPLDKAAAHYRLARAHHAIGNRMDTETHLMAALEIAPHYRPAQRLLLDSINGSAQ